MGEGRALPGGQPDRCWHCSHHLPASLDSFPTTRIQKRRISPVSASQKQSLEQSCCSGRCGSCSSCFRHCVPSAFMDTPQVTDPLCPGHKGGFQGVCPPDSSCLSVCRAHPLRSCCLSFVRSRSFSTCLCRFRHPQAPTRHGCHEPHRGNQQLILKFV